MRNELWVVRASAVQVNKGFPDYRHRDRALSQLPPAFGGLHFILETGAPNPRGCYASPSPHPPFATHNRRSLKELINQPTTIYCRGKNVRPWHLRRHNANLWAGQFHPLCSVEREKKRKDCLVACFEMSSMPTPCVFGCVGCSILLLFCSV